MELTLNQARHLALRAQGLLDRFDEPLKAMEAVVAVQSQYGVSLTPALHARARGVTQKKVDRMLQKDRTLVKSWNLRHTLHCFRTDDLPLFSETMGPELYRRFRTWMADFELFSANDYEQVEQEILAALEAGPLAREELHSRVEILQRLPHAGWGTDVKGLAYRGLLLMSEQGASRSKFALTEQWLGTRENPGPFCTSDLLRRYLRGHGIATVADFRYWVGIGNFDVKGAVAGLGDEVQTVSLNGKPYLVLSDAAEVPDKTPTTCRFLAKFDPLVMGWKDKSLFLPEKYASLVIRPAAQIEATLLLDGKLVATWRLERKGTLGVISVMPFSKIAAGHHGRIEREGQRLLKAMGFKSGRVELPA